MTETKELTRKDVLRNKVIATRGEHEKALTRYGIDPLYFERVVLTALHRDPELLECEQVSLMSAIMEAAQLGLVPDGASGEAYLLHRWDGRQKCKVASLMPGYRGFIKVAYRGGNVSKIVARCVYDRDEFEVLLGTEDRLHHVPCLEEDHGEMTHVYAVAWQNGGAITFEVLTRARVEKIREGTRRNGRVSPAWEHEFEAMAKKTAVRALYRWLNVEPEAQALAIHDERLDTDPGYDGARAVDADVDDAVTSMERLILEGNEPEAGGSDDAGSAPTDSQPEEGGSHAAPASTPDDEPEWGSEEARNS